MEGKRRAIVGDRKGRREIREMYSGRNEGERERKKRERGRGGEYCRREGK